MTLCGTDDVPLNIDTDSRNTVENKNYLIKFQNHKLNVFSLAVTNDQLLYQPQVHT